MAETLFSSTHPPLPPTTEDEQLSWVRLLRSRRVGTSTFYRLIAEHGSAEAALQALPGIAREAGERDYEVFPAGKARGEMDAARRLGAALLCRGAPDYPAALGDLPDAPPLLWAMGDTSLLQRPMIAIVGARNASSLGTRMARSLAQGLAAKGFVVVSGMARGIDTAAHHASIESGTVAVLAGGADNAYPPENAQLFELIGKTGLRLSERPMGLAPRAPDFPRRNRIISGLSRAVIVVEAAARSGSLITARDALDQGREVMAVPGHPFDARAAGCNMLLRDGATLVRGPEDVLEALGSLDEPTATPARPEAARREPVPRGRPAPETPPGASTAPKRGATRSPAAMRALHDQILARLGPSPVQENLLLRDLGLPHDRAAPAITELELEGLVQRQPGGMLSRGG